MVINCTSNHYLIAGAADYTAAKQATSDNVGTNQSVGGQNLTSSLTPVANNCWIVLMEQGFNTNNPPSAGAGLTRRTFGAAFGNWGLFDSNQAITPAASYSMTTTRTSNGTAEVTHIMASFAPNVAGNCAACDMSGF